MRQLMLLGGLPRAADQFFIWSADIEAPGQMQELLAALGFELVPQFIRAAKQRDVIRMLVISHPNHARETVELPSACGISNCSRPRTRTPRRARWWQVEAPIAPTPTTIMSKLDM